MSQTTMEVEAWWQAFPIPLGQTPSLPPARSRTITCLTPWAGRAGAGGVEGPSEMDREGPGGTGWVWDC